MFNAHENLMQANALSTPGTMMTSADLDHMLSRLVLPAVSRLAVVGTLERPPQDFFLRPVFVGPSQSGHFTLLHAEAGTATIFDSSPGYRPGEAASKARELLGDDRPLKLSTLSQGPGECGFVVINKTLKILGLPSIESAKAGVLRAHYAPILQQHRRDTLNDAIGRLRSTLATLHGAGVDCPIPDNVSGILNATPLAVVPTRPEQIPQPATASTPVVAPFPADRRPTQPSSRQQDATAHPAEEARVPAAMISPPPAPTHAPLTHPEVRKVARSLSVGSLLEVAFSFDCEEGAWLGRVDRLPQPGLPAQVSYFQEKCMKCDLWHVLDPVVTTTLPTSGTVYHRLTPRLNPYQTFDCGCTASDSDDEHEDDADGDNDDVPIASPGSRWCKDVETGTIFKAPELAPPAPRRNDPYRPLPVSLSTADNKDMELLYSTLNLDVVCSVGLTASAFRALFVHSDRPPHLPRLAYERLSKQTRATHRRWLLLIRAQSDLYARVPLGTALIEMISKLAASRKWAASTTARAYSDVSSCLRLLPLYTNRSKGISLRDDPIYDQALRHAQALARRIPGRPIRPMTGVDFTNLSTSKLSPSVKAYLLLSWFTAGRLGDVTKLQDVQFIDPPSSAVEGTEVRARFVRGKGPSFRGPYTVNCHVPPPDWRFLRTFVAGRGMDLFTVADQISLTALLKAQGLEARSVRKGRLIHLAERGAGSDELMALSGHLRLDTLRRYLGDAGRLFAHKNDAGSQAAAAIPNSGSVSTPPPPIAVLSGGGATARPVNKMGIHANNRLAGGRRYELPPPFFASKAPSRHALGLLSPETTQAWPLHVKSVPVLNFDRVRELLPLDSSLREFLDRCIPFASSPAHYYAPRTPFHETQVPLSKDFSDADIDLMISVGKIERHTGPIFGHVAAFTVPSKERRRPIFAPSHNVKNLPQYITKHLPQIPALHYPTRASRRVPHAFAIQFDFSAYFDQIEISERLVDRFVCRLSYRGAPTLFHLKRLPMGGCPSPALAQAVTWSLIPWALLERFGDVHVDTMLDNVRFISNDKCHLETVYKAFVQNVSIAGVTMNETVYDLQPPCYDFLGEQYVLQSRVVNGITQRSYVVCNTTSFVRKIEDSKMLFDSFVNLRNPSYSLRNFASFCGLIFWGLATLDFSLCRCFALLGACRAIHKSATTAPWDSPCCTLSREAIEEINSICNLLIANVPRSLSKSNGPTPDLCATIAYVDACSNGWGATVVSRTGATALQQSFQVPVRHSANAEPLAATALLSFLREHPSRFPAPFLIVTDHEAIPRAARSPHSGFRGFSPNPRLNGLFLAAEARRDVCFAYVAGDENPADLLSRTTSSTLLEEVPYEVGGFAPWPRADNKDEMPPPYMR